MKSISVYFDLDGTLFDLYGKRNWLEMLENEKAGAFTTGRLMQNIDKERLLTVVAELANYGVKFNVITWLPMQASREYEEICKAEKIAWVRQNLPFIDEIVCQSYGVPKQNGITKRTARMILIDDNKEVCETWETAKQRTFFNVTKEFSAVNALETILGKIVSGEWA